MWFQISRLWKYEKLKVCCSRIPTLWWSVSTDAGEVEGSLKDSEYQCALAFRREISALNEKPSDWGDFFSFSFKNRIISHFFRMVLVWSYLKGGEWTKRPFKIFLNPLILGFYELCLVDNLGQLCLCVYIFRIVLCLKTSIRRLCSPQLHCFGFFFFCFDLYTLVLANFLTNSPLLIFQTIPINFYWGIFYTILMFIFNERY